LGTRLSQGAFQELPPEQRRELIGGLSPDERDELEKYLKRLKQEPTSRTQKKKK
jgi:hypothetical protein